MTVPPIPSVASSAIAVRHPLPASRSFHNQRRHANAAVGNREHGRWRQWTSPHRRYRRRRGGDEGQDEQHDAESSGGHRHSFPGSSGLFHSARATIRTVEIAIMRDPSLASALGTLFHVAVIDRRTPVATMMGASDVEVAALVRSTLQQQPGFMDEGTVSRWMISTFQDHPLLLKTTISSAYDAVRLVGGGRWMAPSRWDRPTGGRTLRL